VNTAELIYRANTEGNVMICHNNELNRHITIRHSWTTISHSTI